jgi:hypothetical protein
MNMRRLNRKSVIRVCVSLLALFLFCPTFAAQQKTRKKRVRDESGISVIVDKNLVGAGGLCEGTDGCIYIADTFNYCIKRVTLDGKIRVYAGPEHHKDDDGVRDGFRTAARFAFPMAITKGPDGALFIADGNRIRVCETNGMVKTIKLFSTAEANKQEQKSLGQLSLREVLSDKRCMINDLAFGPNKSLYVSEQYYRAVFRFETDGTSRAVFFLTNNLPNSSSAKGDTNSRPVTQYMTGGICVSPTGDIYASTDKDIFRINEDGRARPLLEPEQSLRGERVDSLLLDPEGNLLMGCAESLMVLTPDGQLKEISRRANGNIGWDRNGNLLVSTGDEILKLSRTNLIQRIKSGVRYE